MSHRTPFSAYVGAFITEALTQLPDASVSVKRFVGGDVQFTVEVLLLDRRYFNAKLESGKLLEALADPASIGTIEGKACALTVLDALEKAIGP